MSTAIGMFLLFACLLTYLTPTTRRRVVGLGMALDIAIFVVVFSLFSGTGNERIGALFMSAGITAAIHTYRKLFGYERYRKGRGWVRYSGFFT